MRLNAAVRWHAKNDASGRGLARPECALRRGYSVGSAGAAGGAAMGAGAGRTW